VRALRTTLVDIYPPNLDAGLKPAVAELLEAARADGLSANVRVDVDGRLPAETERVLYRATQEALRNVVAHADATAVDVEIAQADGRAVLTVRDDGRGFAPEEATARRAEGHVGLRLLEDLARDSGGRLDLSSTPGRGTAVRLEVPVT
jgi:two-component system, NarL family, sensor kinase